MKRPTRRQDRAIKTRRALRVEPLESRQLLTTFVVTSNASIGLGTLAAAITLSNADVTQINTIDFAIPGTGPQTIALTTPLPEVTQAVNIDATTQPGYVANTATTGDNGVPAVILDGTNAGSFVDGLNFEPLTPGGSIEGLQVQRFRSNGVFVQGTGVTLADDLIGVDPSQRDVPTGNGQNGLEIFQSSGVTIRGVEVAGSRNDGVYVLRSSGVTINGLDATSNGTYGVDLESSPGTSLSGVVARGGLGGPFRAGDGIRINASDDATLSGVTASDNAQYGIFASASVGLNVTGSTVQGNSIGGVVLDQVTGGSTIAGTTVGGSTSGQGNGTVGVLDIDSPGTIMTDDLITDNAGPGMIVDAGSDATVVAPTIARATITGNAGDGLDINGSTGLSLTSSVIQGNAGTGVSLANQSASAVISSVTIGGTATGQGNAGIGLLVVGSDIASVTGTTVTDNGGFGVELFRSDFASLANDTVGGTTVLGDDLGDGVLAVLSRSLGLTGASITGNAGIGINLDQSASASVQGATVSTNAGGGVDLYQSGSATVSGTTVGGTTSASGNRTVGVLVAGSTNASMTGVVVEGNTGNGLRVSFGSSSVAVSHGTFSNNTGSGILVSASPSPSITGSQVDGNGITGIEFYYSVGGLIASSNIGNLAGNPTFGIEVLNSDNVTMGGSSAAAGDLVSNNVEDGIDVENSGHATIAHDTFEADGGGEVGFNAAILLLGDLNASLDQDTVDKSSHLGIEVGEASSNLSLTNSTITGTGGAGMFVAGSTGLVLTGDTFRGNGVGFSGNDINGAMIGDSSFDDNGEAGLQVGESSDLTIGGSAGPVEASANVDNSQGGGGGGAGLYLDDVTNFTVSGLTTTANHGPGINLVLDTNGTITGSTLGGSTAALGNAADGLLVRSTSGLTVGSTEAPVVVENNAVNGIELNDASNPTLTGDTIEANQADGVNLFGSVGLSLTGSTIKFQGGRGLVVSARSDNATISGNTISGNTGQDIVVIGSKNFVNND